MTFRLCSLYLSPNSSIRLTRTSRNKDRACKSSLRLELEEVGVEDDVDVGEGARNEGPECGIRI